MQNNNFLSLSEIEKQESLDENILKYFQPKYTDISLGDRPKSNFIELMDWCKNKFKSNLADDKLINSYVHNRIIIDGQFYQFAQENNIEIKCLYQDSIISWKTDHNYEKFFVQGVFLIKTKEVEFIHSALFHKGGQNEDEVSFFILCSNGNYKNYISLRNKFDEWVQLRDRGNLHIKVIDGEDLPYTKDHSWDDLFLDSSIKDEIKGLVENFLSSKDFYMKNRIPWKRGLIFFGPPGNGKSSLIRTIISNYNFKPVTITPAANDDVIREAFAYAEEQSPALLYFEDLDSLLEGGIDTSSLLNLIDGISAKNGLLVIATANEVKKLKSSITDRPSRFDRKFEIPLPNQEMAHIYLKKWFGNLITIRKCRDISKSSEKYGFSYAYLKEIYISSMFEALSNNRKTPTEKDIDNAFKRVLKEKNVIDGRSINMDKYLKG